MSILSRKLSPASIGLLYRQLAIMIASDVPIQEAFQLLADESDHRKVRLFAGKVVQELDKGGTPATVLQKYPDIFNEFIVEMLQRSDENAKVSEALIELADAIEDVGIVKAKLVRALFFPAVTLAFGFLFFMGVAVFVLPVFEDMFAGLGGHLPGPTQLLLTISRWIGTNGLYLVVIAIAFFILMTASKRFAYFVGGLIPGFRKLSKLSSLISFSKHLSVMLAFEQPISSAMHKAASTVKNKIHARKLADAADQVTEVKQLNQSLLATGIFSKITLQMIGYGARSNTLALALEEIIKFYERDFERSFNRFLGVLEITAIIATGIVIGYFVIAVYLPVFRMAGAAAM